LSAVVSDAAVLTGTVDSDILRAGSGNSILFDQGTSVNERVANEVQLQGQVFRLYLATLARVPDPGGFVGWFDALQAGQIQLEQTAGAFVGSREFSNVYGNLSNTAFVALLYQNVLGRTAASAEIEYWVGLLETNARTREQVVLGFSESTEFQNRSNPRLDEFMRFARVEWNDVFDGGAGNDTMNAGIGSDTFVFRQGQGGSDVIHGFERWDNLQFSGFGFRSGADAQAVMRQVGTNVIFDHQGQTIRFENTRLADMARVRYNVS
jgi:hypothetical protein